MLNSKLLKMWNKIEKFPKNQISFVSKLLGNYFKFPEIPNLKMEFENSSY